MRRLPVYFLVDVSESALIMKATECINRILCGIRKEPYLIETAFISIITIGESPNIALPITEACIIKTLPELECENGVALGKALELLMKDIDKNVVKTTIEQRGDYRPITFLFIDNTPTDDYSTVLNKWKLNYGRNTFLSVMPGNSTNFLKSIPYPVLSYDKMRDVASVILRILYNYPRILYSYSCNYPVEKIIEEAIRYFDTELNEF